MLLQRAAAVPNAAKGVSTLTLCIPCAQRMRRWVVLLWAFWYWKVVVVPKGV